MKKVILGALMLLAVAGTTMAQTDDLTSTKHSMKKHHSKKHHHKMATMKSDASKTQK